MNKTIRVNPNHFMLHSAKKQRKKSDPSSPSDKEEQKADKLKMKTISQEQSQRDRLIKMLLKQQEKNFKQRDRSLAKIPPPLPLGKPGELHTSLDHLLGIVEEVERQKQTETETDKVVPPTHQGTLKQYPIITNPNVSMMFPSEAVEDVSDVVAPLTGNPIQLHAPQYGCLKYGKLPTYRAYKQQMTQRAAPPLVSPETPLDMEIWRAKEEALVPSLPPKPLRQRKILRRTFKIGKSPVLQRVSVLLSNRTLRKQVNNRKITYKKTPMHEIKTFLIRRGLIKVGTIAPNNILRQIYEDAMLTCGEIYNHNPDVLLHNFMNQ